MSLLYGQPVKIQLVSLSFCSVGKFVLPSLRGSCLYAQLGSGAKNSVRGYAVISGPVRECVREKERERKRVVERWIGKRRSRS